METISVRSLQHYLYCPHRWGLLEIDRAWAENYFVVKANAVHERVHSGESFSARGRKRYTDVDVWDDELGLIGKLDCLEESAAGLCIVEYKPTKPKAGIIRHDDAMQLYAQKLCADKLFKTDCTAEIYYADVRKRFAVTFDASFHDELLTLLAQMRSYIAEGRIPDIRKGQKCSGCSMKDMCMPQVTTRRKHESVADCVRRECEL